jgi:type II secretory pathway component PulC
MSREFPSEQILQNVATPGDGFIVLADTDLHDKDNVSAMVEEIREAHDQFTKKISRLTKKHNINVDIKTIVIADEYS